MKRKDEAEERGHGRWNKGRREKNKKQREVVMEVDEDKLITVVDNGGREKEGGR